LKAHLSGAYDPIAPDIGGAAGYAGLQRMMHAEPTSGPHDNAGGRGASAVRAPRAVRWVTGVAVVALFIGIVSVIATRDPSATSVDSRGHSYATASGERATVTLTDGSRVTLAPQSRLTVTPFGAAARTVSLVGEAYFDVAPAPGAPFIVRTGAVTTRVLGTTFDVRHYAGDSAVRVAVVTGKVAAGGRGAPVTVAAGSVANVTDTTATSLVVSDAGEYADWTNGRLVFDDVAASVMLTTVGRWYGYDFQLTDSTIAARRFKAVFNIAARDKTLAALSALLNVTMTFNGHTVTLHPRTMNRTEAPSRRLQHREAFVPTSEVGK